MDYRVIENVKVSNGIFKLSLDVSPAAHKPIPGQFYNIRCSKTKDPLLRRPFSMHRLTITNGSPCLEILYRVIGKGTEQLSTRKKGEYLDIIGPFGNGFIVGPTATDVVLVARGIGIAPLYAVGEAFFKNHPKPRIHVLMGGRKKERIFYEKELSHIGKVHLYTDDGSLGFPGKAPQLLLHLLKTKILSPGLALYACGPIPMLKELAEISEGFSLDGQVALETHMGCGFGACLSCALPLKPLAINRKAHWKKPALQWSEDGNRVYALICKDGPIFDIQEVDWDEWLA